jgi:hypothetical protein
MTIRNLIAVMGALFVIAAEARACEYDPFLFQLPGEPVEMAQSRSDRIMADASILRRVDREDGAFKQARMIYLARKVASLNDPKSKDALITIRPVHSLRGSLPKGMQTLRFDYGFSGMCGNVGDGDTADLPNGSYLVVFAGMPRGEYRKRGVFSIDVTLVQNTSLLDALRSFGRDLE